VERRSKDHPRWFATEREPIQLTAAQSALMESISRGNMPIEAAAELGIKPATVYTQLTLINAKLGTRHWFGSYLRYAGRRVPGR
jgi:DNA-binding CsgD family transcriptional regulator